MNQRNTLSPFAVDMTTFRFEQAIHWFIGLLVIALLVITLPVKAADTLPTSSDAAVWLNDVANATRQTDYEGVFVFQRPGGMEISHISHLDDKSGEILRLDALSGQPRTFLRRNSEVFCYTPHGHQLDIERHHHRPFFPEVLPEHPDTILNYYQPEFIGQTRIADRESTGLSLLPRDPYRYGYILWADSASHVLLRMVKLDGQQQPVSWFTFTQIDIGHAPERAQFQSGLNDRQTVTVPEHETLVTSNWQVAKMPPGFHLVTAAQFKLPKHNQPVTHLVYSDGLTTVSLFIEALSANDPVRQQGLAQHGIMSLYTRPDNANQITALGGVPPATLMMMADSLQPAAVTK